MPELTDEQRKLYKKSLDAGVPESVIAEWDERLQADVSHSAGSVRAALKTKRKPTTKDGA